jgi:carbamoyltransferase
MTEYILTAFCGHDAGAALLKDGAVTVAIAEERLDRVKHSNATGRPLGQCEDDEGGFPWRAVEYCLETVRLTARDIAVWATNFDGELPELGRERVAFPGHHLCHAALAFYGSGAERCAVLVMDYAGDARWLDEDHFLGYERETAWLGDGTGLTPISQHLGTKGATLLGLGNIYNQLAAYLFGGQDDCEGKLMALAAYGEPNRELGDSFVILRDGQAYVRPSLLFRESLDRPSFLRDDLPHYACDLDWNALPPSPRDGGMLQFHRDLAARMQADLEESVLYLARNLRRITAAETLALAGGVALNCLVNGRVLRDAGFSRVYLPPCAGDSGQAIGAGLLIAASRGYRTAALSGYGGRLHGDNEIERCLAVAADRLAYDRPDRLVESVAAELSDGRIVAWFQGGSEYGPRALGARSIIADPRRREVIERLNLSVKKRLPFQPIAPSILAQECAGWFELTESPYMTFAVPSRAIAHSRVPAVLHADGTSRVHTVTRSSNPLYYDLIAEFHRRSGVPIVANTSFNRRGEPIVEMPEHAVEAYLAMDIDVLAIGGFLARKRRDL